VLRTRSGPNSSSIPCVTPIEPAHLGDVLAHDEDVSSFRIAWRERVSDGLAVGKSQAFLTCPQCMSDVGYIYVRRRCALRRLPR
jgi:hypothetical protein